MVDFHQTSTLKKKKDILIKKFETHQSSHIFLIENSKKRKEEKKNSKNLVWNEGWVFIHLLQLTLLPPNCHRIHLSKEVRHELIMGV